MSPFLRKVSQEQILRMIDETTTPNIMSKEEALEYLGELRMELDMRREALTQEIAELAASRAQGPRPKGGKRS